MTGLIHSSTIIAVFSGSSSKVFFLIARIVGSSPDNSAMGPFLQSDQVAVCSNRELASARAIRIKKKIME